MLQRRGKYERLAVRVVVIYRVPLHLELVVFVKIGDYRSVVNFNAVSVARNSVADFERKREQGGGGLIGIGIEIGIEIVGVVFASIYVWLWKLLRLRLWWKVVWMLRQPPRFRQKSFVWFWPLVW